MRKVSRINGYRNVTTRIQSIIFWSRRLLVLLRGIKPLSKIYYGTKLAEITVHNFSVNLEPQFSGNFYNDYHENGFTYN